MIHSQRSKEGYLQIDNRLAPKLTDVDLAQIAALEKAGAYVAVAAPGTVLEAATITCSHCHMTFMRNPQRVRARGYCPKCDHYICDLCEGVRVATGECLPMKKKLDELEEQLYRQGQQ